ncbi:unannotated protein [freshwater metagenome]|uniref:Unannotated protein n=1 Tax=freshwater metagenome TaxID=449393 RepID=A0A6J6KII7_9ZZZZ
MALAPILDRIGAASTYADAILLFGSISAQLLMVYEKYETWILWLVVNIGYTALYYTQDLYLTSALYLVFTVVAIIGWRRWYATYRRTL